MNILSLFTETWPRNQQCNYTYRDFRRTTVVTHI